MLSLLKPYKYAQNHHQNFHGDAQLLKLIFCHDLKMKTVFESIPIPKYAFSKNKNKIFKTTRSTPHENRIFLENEKYVAFRDTFKI